MPDTILIVDDSPTMRSVMRLYLRESGVKVVDAETGSRALQLARLLKPALAIIDLNLPGMNGVQLAQELRGQQQAEAPRLPVLLVTGETSDEWRQRAESAGVDGLLHKPVSPADLRERVESLLARRAP